MAKIYNSKILDFSSAPLKKPEGQFWYDSSNKVLKRSNGSNFTPIRVDKNIVDDANTTLAAKLSLLDGTLATKQNTLSQYREVEGTSENNYASSVVLQGFSISLIPEDPSGNIITLGDASYSDANQIYLNAAHISGTGVVNDLSSEESEDNIL